MNEFSLSCNETNSVSSEGDITHFSTPKGNSPEKRDNSNWGEQKYSSCERNTSLKERIYSARKHLRKIEKKREAIGHRQVNPMVANIPLLFPFNYVFLSIVPRSTYESF